MEKIDAAWKEHCEYMRSVAEEPNYTSFSAGWNARDPGWHPVSEGLPEVSNWYACMVDDEDGWPVLTEPLWYEPSSQEWSDGDGGKSQSTIIAWMPLPEPYGGEKE